MSMENLPQAPYPGQVEEWQDGGYDELGQGEHYLDSLPNTDDGGASLSEGEGGAGGDNNAHAVESGTRSSKRSNKSARKQPSRVDSGSVIWTRAPQKKSYEPDPFLSIDNLPVEKKRQFIEQQQNAEKSTVRSVSSRPKVPFNSPAPAGREPSSRQSSRPSTGSGWNRLVPKHRKFLSSNNLQGSIAPNHMVKAPFKQSMASRTTTLHRDEVTSPRPVSPGQPMKEKTSAATYHVARSIAKQQPEREIVISGRLLKARLKPISTVSVEGPSMSNCRGIVAGYREAKATLTSVEEADGEGRWAPFAYYKQHKESAAYAMARSRTLQRRQHILRTVGTVPLRRRPGGDADANSPDRPGTSESVHQTSVASSEMSAEDTQRLQELNAELQQLERNAQEALATAAEADGYVEADGALTPSLAYPKVPTNSEVFLTEEQEDDSPVTIETKMAAVHDIPVADNDDDDVIHVDTGNQYVEQEVAVAEETNMAAAAAATTAAAAAITDDGFYRVSSSKSQRGSAKSCLVMAPGSRPPTTEGSQRKVRFSASSTESRAKSTAAEYILETEPESERDEDRTIVHMMQTPEEQGEYNENANNSNNTGRTEPLRMSINDVTFGIERPEPVRSTQRVRPKSAHKGWEDLLKPDVNVTDLAISGKHQDTGNEHETEDECGISVQITAKKNRLNSAKSGGRINSAAARVYNRGSPRGMKAVGPREFMEVERQRERQRMMRPQSAMVLYDPIEVEPQSKALAPRPTTPNVGLGGKRRVVTSAAPHARQRPTSLTSSSSSRMRTSKRVPPPPPPPPPPGSNSAVRSQRRCSSAHTHDPRVPVTAQCCVCIRKIKRYLSADEARDKDAIMCKDCQTFKGIVAEYNAIAAPNRTDTDTAEPKPAIEYDQDAINEDELGIIDDVVDSDEEEQGFEVMTNVDDIERSLTEIRGQLKESQAKYSRKHEEEAKDAEEEQKRVRFEDNADDDDDEIFLTEACKLVESTIKSAVQEERDRYTKGETSTVLVDCKELPPKTPAVKPLLSHMQVYHLDQENGENQSDISTFPMTCMGDEGTGQCFLEMLLAELPEEETTPAVKRAPSPALEVNAQPARMTAAKNVAMPASIAPFSPLCFKINARPPAGYLYYFAYGIDMNPNRFATYIGRQHAERSWGLLMGFKLAFDRTVGDAGCFPNVQPDACSSVEGCLYLITPTERQRLHTHMECPQKLQQAMLPVWLLNCDSPSELGVMQYCVPALLYIAMDAAVHPDPSQVDSSYAVEQCVKGGADVLSPAYMEHLQAIQRSSKQPDPSPNS